MKPRILIVGCGYVGERLLPRLGAFAVQALTRDADRAARLSRRGAAAIAGDLDDGTGLHRLLPAEAVFHLAPPQQAGHADLRTRRLLAHLAPAGRRPRTIVYVSSTGVYGDRGGAWLDESSAIAPHNARAIRRADAERQLRAFGRAHGVRVVILRVPGIYGPGRLPLDKIRAGQPVVDYDPPHYGNRIHVDDLVQALLAAWRHGRANRIYLACDGHPSPQADFLDVVADAAGLPRPPHIPPAQAGRRLSPLSLSFLEESRRLRNTRLLRELGVRLRYPQARDGVAASLAEESAQGA